MKKNLLILTTCLISFFGQTQTHTIEIHPNNRVASLLMTPTEYSDWITNDDYNNTAKREALFQDIYQKFDDDFDFIFLVLNEDVRPSNLPYGQLIQVYNNTSGIGLGNFDNTSNYGSTGQLQSVIQLTRRDYLRSGPSLHELLHNWGNFGIPTESVSGLGTGLTSFSYQPHWGFTGGSAKGQHGGFGQSTLVDNGGGNYTVESFGGNANGGNSIPYNEMELYLMGMIPLSSVSNFDAFSSITSLADNGNSTFTFDAGTRTTYTPASIQTLLGSRLPASTTSQKDFKALVIILTDAPLTTAEWDIVDVDSEKFSRPSSDGSSSYNFWEATNGAGTLETGNLQNSTTVGLEEEEISFTMYPNPTNIQFTLNNIPQNAEIEIYNILGERLIHILPLSNSTTINVLDLNSGTYFVKINTDNQSITKKLIVKH